MTRIVRLLVVLGVTLAMGACASAGRGKTAAPTTNAALTSGAPSTNPTNCASSTTVAGSNNGPETNPAGDIPDQQPFKVYSSPNRLYSVKVPQGWALIESAGDASFTDKLNSIDVRLVDGTTAPTLESVKAAEVPRLAATVPCFQLMNVVTAKRSAGDAILITYRADAAPDPVTGKKVRDDVERYEFFKGGKEVILTLSAPAGSDNVDPWRVVTDSFTWT